MIVTTVEERIYESVETEYLFADVRYQRPVVPAEVDLIASDFDIRVYGVLLVSVRKDGSYALIDGQQRFHAAVKVGVRQVPCELLFGLSLQEEAVLYVKVNKNRKRLSPLDIFKAEVVSKDATALKVKQILEDNGFIPTASNSQSAWAGVASLMNTMRKRGACSGEVATRIGVEVGAGWRDRGASRPQDADVFRGVAQFALTHWGEFDPEVFKDCLWNTSTPTTIMERARPLVKTARGGAHVTGQYTVVAQTYNRCVGRKHAVTIKKRPALKED